MVSDRRDRIGKERRPILKRIVILRGYSIDSICEGVLRGCLKIVFPECEIEIRSRPPAGSPDEEVRINPGKDRFAII